MRIADKAIRPGAKIRNAPQMTYDAAITPIHALSEAKQNASSIGALFRIRRWRSPDDPRRPQSRMVSRKLLRSRHSRRPHSAEEFLSHRGRRWDRILYAIPQVPPEVE